MPIKNHLVIAGMMIVLIGCKAELERQRKMREEMERRYDGVVTASRESKFNNYFGSTVRMHIGVSLSTGGFVAVECMDGLTSDIEECFGLKEGQRVQVYHRESGSWGISRRY